MLLVRYVVLTALVVWLGGMVVLGGLVVPSAARVLQAADPAGGPQLAGTLLADLLRQFHLVTAVCGAVVLVGLFLMKFVGPPPAAFVLRASIAAVMLGLAVYGGLPVSRLSSTSLMTINMGLGLVSLFWYARE